MTASPQSFWRRHRNLILVAGGNLACRYRLRFFLLTLSLSVILFPFITALSISEGIKLQSRISVEEGADFYVSGDAAGSSSPLSLSELDRFRRIPGVAAVVPRIVGRAYLDERALTIVGMPHVNLPQSILLAGGRGIRNGGDAIVGASLRSRYNLDPGFKFYLPINSRKHFTVTGVFSSKCSMWSANLIYMSLEDAGELFKMNGKATDFLIYAGPGQSGAVNLRLQAEARTDPPLRIQSRELVYSYFQKGFESKAGVFTAFYIPAFALAIPLLFLLTGLGWAERRREIGTLKAVGWNTLDVITVVVWENISISLLAASCAIGLAIVWIRIFNGFFIGQFFIGDSGFMPVFPLPARFVPAPAFLAFLLALTLMMAGSLFNTWRTAATPPGETMR